MKLSEMHARAQLGDHDHGVLCTLNSLRGVDAVPVVYAAALADGLVGVPVDRVKAKSSMRLQRERNLEADPRATLLIEHWDRDDWSQLWWVRAELEWAGRNSAEHEDVFAAELERRFVQYRDRPFAQILVFRITTVSGWAASDTEQRGL